jgi:hypothetical protein
MEEQAFKHLAVDMLPLLQFSVFFPSCKNQLQ